MLDKIAYHFIRPFPYGEKIAFFRKVIYIFLLLNGITLLPIAHELFAYHGIVGTGGWNTEVPWYAQGSRSLLNVLSHPLNASYSWIAPFFVYGQLLAIVLGLLRIWPRLMAVLIYFFTVNLFIKGYLAFTGGEALLSLLLFYLIFIEDPKRDRKISSSFLQTVLNNTFYWVMLVQVVVVYFFSTLYKLIDSYWIDGSAMLYISRIDAFSGSTLRFLFSESPVLSLIATYLVLIYQGLFPIVVWIKAWKVPFLIFGVLLHMTIAFAMGIFTFGIVMCLVYLLFLEDDQLQKIKSYIVRLMPRFKG